MFLCPFVLEGSIMKYCINYYGKQLDLLNEIEEINIELDHITNLERDIEEFCELHKNQRLNFIIPNYEQMVDKGYLLYIFDFQQTHKEYNIYIRLPYIDETYYPALKEKYTNMKFFFELKIKDWDSLIGIINEGVSDVYIVEEFCFNLKDIAAVAHSNNVRVRVFPNVAQSSWESTPALKKFWIRPEDIHYYEDYIDVCELYGKYEQQKIYYEVYKQDEKWTGNLRFLIIGLDQDIDNTCLLPRFGDKRVNCKHRCFQGINCQMCDVIFDLSKNLEKTGLRIIIDKNMEEEEINNGERISEQSSSI